MIYQKETIGLDPFNQDKHQTDHHQLRQYQVLIMEFQLLTLSMQINQVKYEQLSKIRTNRWNNKCK